MNILGGRGRGQKRISCWAKQGVAEEKLLLPASTTRAHVRALLGTDAASAVEPRENVGRARLMLARHRRAQTGITPRNARGWQVKVWRPVAKPAALQRGCGEAEVGREGAES